MVRVLLQARVINPFHLRVGIKVARHSKRIATVPFHSQGQSFQPLQGEKAIERRDGRAHVAQRH